MVTPRKAAILDAASRLGRLSPEKIREIVVR